jgi:hypothetical protein
MTGAGRNLQEPVYLPSSPLTLEEARRRLAAWHFNKEALTAEERQILAVAEALLRLIDEPSARARPKGPARSGKERPGGSDEDIDAGGPWLHGPWLPSPVPSDEGNPWPERAPFTAFGQRGEDQLDLRVFEQCVWWVDRHGVPHALETMSEQYIETSSFSWTYLLCSTSKHSA